MKVKMKRVKAENVMQWEAAEPTELESLRSEVNGLRNENKSLCRKIRSLDAAFHAVINTLSE